MKHGLTALGDNIHSYTNFPISDIIEMRRLLQELQEDGIDVNYFKKDKGETFRTLLRQIKERDIRNIVVDLEQEEREKDKEGKIESFLKQAMQVAMLNENYNYFFLSLVSSSPREESDVTASLSAVILLFPVTSQPLCKGKTSIQSRGRVRRSSKIFYPSRNYILIEKQDKMSRHLDVHQFQSALSP